MLKVMGDKEYMTIFISIVLPVIREFQPEFIFVSAGESKTIHLLLRL